MRQSLKPGMSDEEKRRFDDLMMNMKRDIPPLSEPDEMAVLRLERDLERRAQVARLKLDKKPGMFEALGEFFTRFVVPVGAAIIASIIVAVKS